MAVTADQFAAHPKWPGSFPLPSGVLRLPGVYRPQADTALLAEVIATTTPSGPERILDAFAGTGVLATLAAQRPGAEVTALDVSRRAAVTTWWNGRRRGLSIQVRRASLLELDATEAFDLVLANPPYVPCARGSAATGRRRAWDAGPDGRSALDPLCANAPRLLASQGRLLIVQSAVSGVDASLARLRAGGLVARVVARRTITFGPVMRSRVDFLEEAGLIARGCREEELVVIRADRT
jgi:release factor glutamine methyltransferase